MSPNAITAEDIARSKSVLMLSPPKPVTGAPGVVLAVCAKAVLVVCVRSSTGIISKGSSRPRDI